MSDNNSTTHMSHGRTILSRLGSMLMRMVHVFLTLLQTSHVAVVALLIDGENISPDLAAQMLVEAGKFGGVMIRRVYGNVTSPNMQRWKEVMTQYALQGMHQMQTVTGKNAADIALAVDAMDLFYRDHVTRFCIVGSDSDYTPLVLRLRSVGCMVIGIGELKTSPTLVKAYTVFVSTDQLTLRSARTKPTVVSSAKVAPTAQIPTTKKKISPPTLAIKPNTELTDLLSRAYKEATKGKASEWVLISQLGIVLRKIDPSFKTKDYGQKDLSSLLMKHEDLFEIRKRSGRGGHLELRLQK
jgi:NYN domain/OST-HTH/LOTUS domain